MSAPEGAAPLLSVVVTVTSGGLHVERCLEALTSQRGAPPFEILVPVDPTVEGVPGWRERFPQVLFPPSGPGDATSVSRDPGQAHLAYDRRRSAGLAAARGRLVALTEDHARPAADWCAQIADAHARLPHAVIGGAIENATDLPLTWAVYFCDFGRYQRPFFEGPAAYVSDVNVSYKRSVLETVSAAWRPSYHETAVHGALRARGQKLWLCPRIVVHQERGRLVLGAVLRERFAWGRLYAGKRAHEVGAARRWLLALGSPLLPALLLFRHLRTAWTRGRHKRAFLRAVPWIALLLAFWSAGEAVGLVTGRPVRGESRA